MSNYTSQELRTCADAVDAEAAAAHVEKPLEATSLAPSTVSKQTSNAAPENVPPEKRRRIYYQDIVYKICNIVDLIDGKKPGTGIVCGTVESPSTELQDRVDSLRDELATLKAEIVRKDLALRPFAELATRWNPRDRYRASHTDSVPLSLLWNAAEALSPTAPQ